MKVAAIDGLARQKAIMMDAQIFSLIKGDHYNNFTVSVRHSRGK
jgi:hypothetical protein